MRKILYAKGIFRRIFNWLFKISPEPAFNMGAN